MFTISNLFKTLLIAIMVGLSYGVYEASTSFQQQPMFNPDQNLSRIAALFEASKTMDARYFWPHLVKQWLQFSVVIFISCGLLLAVAKPSQK